MTLLKYKGITFDGWVDTEIEKGRRQIWSEMCQSHIEKNWNILAQEIDYEDSTCGTCGICGCSVTGNNESIDVYYIDFDIDEVEFVES